MSSRRNPHRQARPACFSSSEVHSSRPSGSPAEASLLSDSLRDSLVSGVLPLLSDVQLARLACVCSALRETVYGQPSLWRASVQLPPQHPSISTLDRAGVQSLLRRRSQAAANALAGSFERITLQDCKASEPLLLFSRDAQRLVVLDYDEYGPSEDGESFLGLYDVQSGQELWKRPLSDLEEELGDSPDFQIVPKNLALAWSADNSSLQGVQILDHPLDRDYDDFEGAHYAGWEVQAFTIAAKDGALTAGITFCPDTHMPKSGLCADRHVAVIRCNQSLSPDASLLCLEVAWHTPLTEDEAYKREEPTGPFAQGICHFVLESATGAVILQESDREESSSRDEPGPQCIKPCWSANGRHVATAVFLDDVVSRQSLHIDIGEDVKFCDMFSSCFDSKDDLLGCTVAPAGAFMHNMMHGTITAGAAVIDVSSATITFGVQGYHFAAFTMQQHALLMKPLAACCELWDIQREERICSINLQHVCRSPRMGIEFGLNDKLIIGTLQSDNETPDESSATFGDIMNVGGNAPGGSYLPFDSTPGIFNAVTGARLMTMSRVRNLKQSPDGLTFALVGGSHESDSPQSGWDEDVSVLKLV